MTAFTRLGSGIWDWERWTDLAAKEHGSAAQILWLALYTSAEAKRHVPGLWQGGIPVMAEAAHMRADTVVDALDVLLEADLVEYEPKYRVLRLCELPDAGEFPSNGKVLLGWWTKFRTVPACQVRDAHVRTLAWIMDEGSKRSGNPVSPHHREAWERTFATIVVPAPRRRGIRRLADSDTGTAAQPSLFGPAASSVPAGYGMPISDAASYPQNPQPSVDNSAVLRQPNKINSPETVSDTVSDTNRIPDPGSRIPDLYSSSGEGVQGGAVGTTVRPLLTLVPAFTAGEVLAELGQGNWDGSADKGYQDALGALIPRWAALGVVLADFAMLADYNTHAGRRWDARLLVGCDILAEISCARRTLDWRAARVASLVERT